MSQLNLFNSSFHFIESNITEDIYIDVEESMLYGNFDDFIGDSVVVSYQEIIKNKIKKWDKPLNEAEEKEIDPAWEVITGTISGAESITNGDTPDKVWIQNEERTDFYIERYIDSEMVAINNTVVTVYYIPIKTKKIIGIRLAE